MNTIKKNESYYWVSNICNRNVSLADLNLTIKAFSSVNLLDKKHYNFTIDQLEKSASNGSIANKNKIIVVRKVAPTAIEMNTPLLNETYISSRERSVLNIEKEEYEELNVSDEQFAEENAETAELDTQKMIIPSKS